MPDLVLAWLDAAEARGHRAPHHLLPELLALATREERLRPVVRLVADARGAWLAAANPEWRWAVDAPATQAGGLDAQAWARLTTDERVAQAQRMRASDPTAALVLIESTWKSDSAARPREVAVGIGNRDRPG